jgi:ribonuclease T2
MPSSADDSGDFDLYLLAQTWAPQWCCVRADRCSTVPWAFSARHFSLHGLWPGFAVPRAGGSTFPESCRVKAQVLTSQLLPREYIDMAPSFTQWNAAEHRPEVGPLARHEWKKHGTCSGLSPDSYFNEALRAMQALPGDRGTPALVSDNVGGAVSAAALRAEYPKRVALRANKDCILSEVTSCWEKRADGRVGALIDCPSHVMRGRDTACATLKITELGKCLRKAGKKGGR